MAERARARGRRACPATGGTASTPTPSAERLAADTGHEIKAVCVVHNETSTGVTSRVAEIRAAIDARRPPGAAAGRHHLLARLDRLPPRRVGRRRHRRRLAEGPDAAAGAGLQRGQRQGARGRRGRAGCRESYWDWEPILEANARGFFPYTPATNLLYGLREALRMLDEEGLPAGLRPPPAARRGHPRRRPRRGAWRCCALDEREHSGSLTAVLVPDGHDADEVRRVVLERYDMSLGRRARQAGRQGLPDRPPRPLQRPDAGGHAGRRADGPAAGRGADRDRRRRGRAGACWSSHDGDVAAEPAARRG